MADQLASPKVLQGARRPDGRLQVTVAVLWNIGGPTSAPVAVPEHTFILTQEEEDNFLAALGGISIARELPNALSIKQ